MKKKILLSKKRCLSLINLTNISFEFTANSYSKNTLDIHIYKGSTLNMFILNFPFSILVEMMLQAWPTGALKYSSSVVRLFSINMIETDLDLDSDCLY